MKFTNLLTKKNIGVALGVIGTGFGVAAGFVLKEAFKKGSEEVEVEDAEPEETDLTATDVTEEVEATTEEE